ncbi:hypothetical protein DO021_21965 [Desulfobacter hydrogenophilus]|uniref:DUF1308 domain-containing protein n=1 Tax=Desulfobacter hydrogenophilus TaxID=2291 RepID=A0A328F6B6_9BACT|nr:DUF4157 domain-containing protein [Desulfobacter hydrogenophilus]NDY73278.1 DUF1308 domain-containing protein [Desulfobacter hydrogenophilus]QBH15262.1 DUF1308 domain-containing protein [Desulfobacter hydrogenophilus]RAL99898.1 hypothetical protein DO021_21965 [Desulfobacter hydrogenophilus]
MQKTLQNTNNEQKTDTAVPAPRENSKDTHAERTYQAGVPLFLQRFAASSSLPQFQRDVVEKKKREKETPEVLPKLTVGTSDDEYEREADRVADTVMRMSDMNGIHPSQTPNPGLQAHAVNPKLSPLIRRKADEANPKYHTAVESDIQSLWGRGQSLSPDTQEFFETRFAADFSQVRVHTGLQAENVTQAIHARAFTHGNNIVFGAGEYAPRTNSGKVLLAHELTHVVQQRHRKPAGQIQRMPGELQQQIRRIIADEDTAAINSISAELLNATSPGQRAGMVRILTNQLWVGSGSEATIVRLIGHNRQHRQVIEVLNMIGYCRRVVDAVDDDELSMTLRVYGMDAGTPTAPRGDESVATAIESDQSSQIMQLEMTSIRNAGDSQRLGMLRILLGMSWSNAAEEGRIIDILGTSQGLGSVMHDLSSVGLKQSLFNHIDSQVNKNRLTTLLARLDDPTINEDLRVFNQSFWENLGEGILGGLSLALSQFSLGAIIMGMLHPIIHPIDSIGNILDQFLGIFQDFSIDRLLTFCRDICGFVGMWLLVATGIAWGVAGLAAAGVITLPASVPIAAIATGLTAWAATVGICFIAFAIIKTVWDLIQAGSATTARGLEREEEHIAEDVTLLAVVAMFAGLVRGLKAIIRSVRGPAVEPEAAEPGRLNEAAEQVRDGQAEAQRTAEQIRDTSTEARETQARPPERSLFDRNALPEDMQQAYDGLNSDLARAEFERLAQRFANDQVPYERLRRAVKGMRRNGGDLQGRLETAARRATAEPPVETPRGEVEAAREVKHDAEGLREQLQQNTEIEGTDRLIDRLNQMIDGPLRRMTGDERGHAPDVATPERVQGARNNIESIRAEWRAAQEATGVEAVSRDVPYTNEAGTQTHVDVDVVAENGRTWIEVKNKAPFGLRHPETAPRHRGALHRGWIDLANQVRRLQRAARQNQVDGQPPRIRVRFPKGVSFGVRTMLRIMGVEVEAARVVDIGDLPSGELIPQGPIPDETLEETEGQME